MFDEKLADEFVVDQSQEIPTKNILKNVSDFIEKHPVAVLFTATLLTAMVVDKWYVSMISRGLTKTLNKFYVVM